MDYGITERGGRVLLVPRYHQRCFCFLCLFAVQCSFGQIRLLEHRDRPFRILDLALGMAAPVIDPKLQQRSTNFSMEVTELQITSFSVTAIVILH